MVQRLVGPALGVDRVGIAGEEAVAHGGPVDQSDDAIDCDPGTDFRPVEGLDQGLRQRQARGLDYDVIGRIGPVEQRLHGRDEVVGHGAADAAVGQLHDTVLLAALDAAALEDLAVDSEVAELVDDQGDARAVGRRQQVADGRGLAGTEEAGIHGRRDLGLSFHRGIPIKPA